MHGLLGVYLMTTGKGREVCFVSRPSDSVHQLTNQPTFRTSCQVHAEALSSSKIQWNVVSREAEISGCEDTKLRIERCLVRFPLRAVIFSLSLSVSLSPLSLGVVGLVFVPSDDTQYLVSQDMRTLNFPSPRNKDVIPVKFCGNSTYIRR